MMKFYEYMKKHNVWTDDEYDYVKFKETLLTGDTKIHGTRDNLDRFKTISDILTEIGQETEDGISYLENVLRTVYKKAINGDMKAIEFIADRTEGKPVLMEKKTYTRPFDSVVFIEDGKEINCYDGI